MHVRELHTYVHVNRKSWGWLNSLSATCKMTCLFINIKQSTFHEVTFLMQFFFFIICYYYFWGRWGGGLVDKTPIVFVLINYFRLKPVSLRHRFPIV